MTISTRYANAFTEVYEILQHLERSKYQKISSELITTIKNNRNKNYIYVINSEKELKEQEMLPETKALLFNIFRDYLASEDQKQTIQKWQLEESKQLEKEKKKYYNIKIFNNKTLSNNPNLQSSPTIQNEANTNLMEIKQQTLWKKLITLIKKFFIK